MILFKENTASVLAESIIDQYIDSVLIASYGLAIQIGDVTIHCNERVFASIGDTNYEWSDAPSEIPWGLIVRQKVTGVDLTTPSTLRINLKSDDSITIETVECQYESVVINYPQQGENLVMDIY